MGQHEVKKEILRKYYKRIETSYGFYISDEISSYRIENAKNTFAPDLDLNSVIGFYDTTQIGNGKCGYVFTDTEVYSQEVLETPKRLWYDDIKDVELFDIEKKDNERGIRFYLNDDKRIEWKSNYLNKEPLLFFFTELLQYINSDRAGVKSTENRSSHSSGAIAGGIATGNYGETNKLYEEERFHATKGGHGFAAERANTLYDRLTGHDARIVGDDNSKNGPDRIVDGVYIQSKYYPTGKKCIDACFDDNGFRYLKDGKPMQIEVPADKYDEAVSAMQEKIRNGQVPGVTDPAEAKNIVRKGHFTYEQAKNIAKAGTVESLTYDAVNGAIIASTAFGVTAAITLAVNIWNGESFEKSLKNATYSGLKVGGTAFITTVLASQLSKAGLNSALVGSSEAIVAFMGPKASAVLINAFRSGSNIYGAAAMKSAAKLLRGNVITAGVTVVVLSSFDIANLFRGRISGKQLFKNVTNTATTVTAGYGGWLGGAAIGSAIFPGVGTIVGGLIGSIAAGAVAGKATDAVLGEFIEDDADEMIRIIQNVFSDLAADYLLNQEEAEAIVNNLQNQLDGGKLKDMYSSKDRIIFAKEILQPLILDEVKKRQRIKTLTNEEMTRGLKEVLEEIADANEANSSTRDADSVANNPFPPRSYLQSTI